MIEIGPLFMEYNNISLELQDVSSWILDQLNVCYSKSIYSKLQKKIKNLSTTWDLLFSKSSNSIKLYSN